jgi:hypothetical protein
MTNLLERASPLIEPHVPYLSYQIPTGAKCLVAFKHVKSGYFAPPLSRS